ncbi:hypothetical protein HEK616_80770 (plasmid) [Streptomyces nigrescens]|uniref:Secreted protein n=2 Tax=Streptomyces TaxID=1883 RepID=A0ABN6R884_STRNI|nr:hypothetical protein [Streptomyces nigrescens]MEE4420692.1 hypothetical protein [Streptomyces sp. DSM 41528]BDM74590.1 hypothetical protein HEK616_80770 [Streptomyces nigrescens]
MRVIRIALLVMGAVVAPFFGFLLGAMAAAVLVRPLTGDPATVDTAIPLVGLGGTTAAVVGWIRLLRLAHYRHLRRLRRSGPAVQGKVVAARTSFAKNPRGPGHWTVRLEVVWTDPRNGHTHQASKAFRFAERHGEDAHDFQRRHRAESSIGVLPGRRRGFLLDVPELPAWWDRW